MSTSQQAVVAFKFWNVFHLLFVCNWESIRICFERQGGWGREEIRFNFCSWSSNLFYSILRSYKICTCSCVVLKVCTICVFSQSSASTILWKIQFTGLFHFVTKLPCLFTRIFLAICYNLRAISSCISNLLD